MINMYYIMTDLEIVVDSKKLFYLKLFQSFIK